MKWNVESEAKGRRSSRIGVLSLITYMVLTLSSGVVVAADEFKLWQKPAGATKFQALEHLKTEGSDSEKAKALKWLSGSEANFDKFVSTFKSEPFKFVEALRTGMIEANKEGKLEAFTKDVVKGLSSVEAKKFGSTAKKDALLNDIVFNLFNKKIEDLEKGELDALLKELFEDDSILALLGLRRENPDKEKTDTKTETKTETETKTKTDTATTTNTNTSTNTGTVTRTETGTNTVPTTSTNTNTAPSVDLKPITDELARLRNEMSTIRTAQPPQQLRTGEVDDSALRAQAQQICDKFNALQKGFEQNLTNSIDPIRNALNETFNRLADVSRVNNQGQQQNRNRLDEILPGLLADSLKNNQNQQVIPPQQPAFPQSARNNRDNDRNDNGIFNQPLPEKQEQPQQQPQPLTFPQTAASNLNHKPISLNLPSTNGRMELREADDIAGQNEIRSPIAASLSAQSGIPELVMAKVKVQTDVKRTQAALQNAKDRAARLDEQLEELKEGGRAALPDWVKREESRLSQELEAKKRQLEQSKQQAQQAAQANPEAAQQIGAQIFQMTNDVNQAEQALKQFQAEVEIKVEEGNKQIKSLAKMRDRLNQTASKLEGQLGGLKEEESTVQQLINTNMQMQVQQMQGAQAGAPVLNVRDRISGYGGRSGASRSVPSSLNRSSQSLQSGSTNTSTSGVIRGQLGK